MADNNNDRPGPEDASLLDTDEYLKTIFREEVNGIPAEAKRKTRSKYGDKPSPPEKPESTSQVEGATRKGPGGQIAIDKRKTVRRYAASRVHVDRPERVAPEKDILLKEAVEEKRAPQVRDETRKEIILEDIVEIGRTKGGNIEFGGRSGQGYDRLKILLLCIILTAALVSTIHSLGIVDFGRLFGFSEPNKEARRKIPDEKEPFVKRSTRTAVKSTRETTRPTTSDKAHSQEVTSTIKIPSEAALPEETPPAMEGRTASTQKPVGAEPLPKPAAGDQESDVPEQPAGLAMSAQDLSVTAPPAQFQDTTLEPVAAQKPPEPTPPEDDHLAVETPSKSGDQTRQEVALGKEELFPEKIDPSYPYSVYLGSFKTLERTERAISEHRMKGLSPYCVKVDLGDKGVWYRVFSGYFEKREQADEFIEKNQLVGAQSRHTKYANLIGVFASQKELDERKVQLSRLGYLPYVILAPDGKSRLYVGAFYQEVRAQQQHEDLASTGIPSQIVER